MACTVRQPLPFSTAPSLGTMVADNVAITGGCIDVDELYVRGQPVHGYDIDPAFAVDTMALLRAFRVPRNGATITLLGYREVGDKPPALYQYDASNESDDDGGGIVKPDSINSDDPGRWILQVGEYVNILDWGADPLGVIDSTAEITAAVITTRNGRRLTVCVPEGAFTVTDKIALGGGQRLVGMGRGISTIRVPNTFNLAATGVIQLGYTTSLSAGSVGSEVSGISIAFDQPDSSDREDMVQYPPAIYMQSVARAKIDNVRISGAWDGIHALGNTGGSYFGFIEVGAINNGIRFGGTAEVPTTGALDFVHIQNFHFWPWGFETANQLVAFKDGNTQACTFGRVDGLDVDSITAYFGNVSFTNSTTLAPASIGRLIMDGDNQKLIIEGQQVVISTLHTKTLTNTTCFTVGDDAYVIVGAFDMVAGGSVIDKDAVVVDGVGSRLLINSGRILQTNGNVGAFHVKNGELSLHNTFLRQTGTVTRTVGVVRQTGSTSNLIMMGNRLTTKAATASGLALEVENDHSRNFIANNDFSGWDVSLPSDLSLGEYGPNNISFSLTPVVTFTTPGDFAPVYTTRFGTYQFLGNGVVRVHLLLTFDTNAYTVGGGGGASGLFRVRPGIPVRPTVVSPMAISSLSNLTFPGACVEAQMLTDGDITLTSPSSGAASSSLSTSAVPPSTTGVTFRITGTFRHK